MRLALALQFVPHPRSVTCPTCKAAAGDQCKSLRPPYAKIWAWHAARVRAAQDSAL